MNEFWQTNTVVNNEVCPVDVLENIKTKIKIHHQLYQTLTIKDKYWECILAQSFIDANFTCNWNPESHVVGKDIVVEGLKHERISCKSGTWSYLKRKNRLGQLNISSYRTTKYKTIEEKLNHIDSNHEDIMYSLSSTFFKSKKKYILTIFTPPKFKKLTWAAHTTKKNRIVYKSTKLDGVIAKINSTQSDQLWYKLDYDCPLILEKHEIQL